VGIARGGGEGAARPASIDFMRAGEGTKKKFPCGERLKIYQRNGRGRGTYSREGTFANGCSGKAGRKGGKQREEKRSKGGQAEGGPV